MTHTLRESTSWLGTLAQPSSADLKFNTLALGNARSAARGRPGLFEEDLPSARNGSRGRIDEELQDLQGLREADAGWSVTVAEGPKARSRARKPDPCLTVYCSTPTSSLTLTRNLSEIVDLEERLRAQFPNSLPPPKLPSAPPSTPKKRNNVLASLTRTLSPRRGQASFTSFGAATKEARAVDVKEFGAFLTSASLVGSIRSHSAWRSFFVVRKDDLESVRVERRVKRARSDQTMHLGETGHGFSSGTPLEAIKSRSDRQDLSNGTSGTSTTDEMIKPAHGQNRISVFDLPDIPSATIKMETPRPASDVEVSDGERRQPSSVVMADATPPASPAVAMVDSVDLAPLSSASPPETTPTVSPSAPPAETVASLFSPPPPAAQTADLGVVESSPVLFNEPLTATSVDTAATEPAPAKGVRRSPKKPKKSKSLRPPTSESEALHAMSRSFSNLTSSSSFEKKPGAVTLSSFDILRVLGKGCAGKVLLVKEKASGQALALKAITKRHVLAHRELQHTRTEQTVLKTCARDKSNPFVVKLHYSFHDADTLYLALDFHPGGDLATQLARWGRLGRDRARFYIAEICEGVEGLHRAGIIYRDLKPENVLISHDGHIVLTDFGLSKDFGHSRVEPPTSDGLPRPHWLDQSSRSASTPPASTWLFGRRETTMSFCGTAEYLAPEVLLGEPYSYEVDTWSAGTMLYEMLSGVTPFYAEDHATMYRRVLHDDLVFDDPRIFDNDTKALIRGMLQRDPLLRMSDTRIKRHSYFNMVDFRFVRERRYVPPWVPTLNADDPTDLSQFDDVFLSMPAQVKGDPEDEPGADRDPPEGEPQAPIDEHGRDVFDGYSYFGRDSASIHRQAMADEAESSEETGELDGADEVEDESEEEAVDEPTLAVDEAVSTAKLEAEVSPAAQPPTVEEVKGDVASPAPHVEEDRFRSSTPPPAPHARAVSSDADLSLDTEAGGDLTLSSIMTDSTAATSASEDSPTLVRTRQLSSRSNLEPLAEERLSAAPPVDVVLESTEEHSDSEWDVVEGGDAGQSARNGGREATFFARGIKDRYRLVLAPLGTPLRPPPASRSSRQNSRKGSSSSVHSALSLSTPASTTPEPPSGSLPSRPGGGIRRLASMRSSTSGNSKTAGLRSKKSQRSLNERSSRSRTAPPSPQIDRSLTKRSMVPSSSTPTLDLEATPRKSHNPLKKLAKSGFLSSSTSRGA
ncbi:hypothetical protein JCM10207_003125 [Rhodosporidiobolus poonsookiae]